MIRKVLRQKPVPRTQGSAESNLGGQRRLLGGMKGQDRAAK